MSEINYSLVFNKIVSHRYFQNFILFVIVLNAIILGLEESNDISLYTFNLLYSLDSACLVVFVLEIIMKFIAFKWQFFKDGWNIFDFIIVAICLLPNSGIFSVFLVFRIFRAFRMISNIYRLRVIVNSILYTLPSIAWVAVLLFVIFYIFAVIGTNLYGLAYPDFFATVGASMFSLFQIMTLESWATNIARPIMADNPCAFLYFIPFILSTSFVILNIVIGIVCNAMSIVEREGLARKAAKEKDNNKDLSRGEYLQKLKSIQMELADVIKKLDEK